MRIIELDNSKVEFSNNDIKTEIKIPSFLTEDLCYETGTHIGDGHISCYDRIDGTLYLVEYSGDFRDEYDFHQFVLIPILENLYNKKLLPYKSTKNTVKLVIKSKAITTFKLNSLGLTNGRKDGKIKIPKIIMDSNIEMKKSCLSGIFDIDFSLVFRHCKYPKIPVEMTSKNKILKNHILEILDELGISYTSCRTKSFDERLKIGYSEGFNVDINGRENLEKWVKCAGFRSPKHLVKLELWRAYGFCKPFLSYNKRKEMLNASLAQFGRALIKPI